MCHKNSDQKRTVFGKGSRFFVGFLSAAAFYWFISAIHAAIKMHEIHVRLGGKKSFIETLMEVMGFAFPAKTLVIGLVFGFIWYMYSKRRKDINEAKEAAETEKVTEETAPEQEEIIEPVHYKQQ